MDYTEYVIRQHNFQKACNNLGKILVTVKAERGHITCDGDFATATLEFVEAVSKLSGLVVKEENK